MKDPKNTDLDLELATRLRLGAIAAMEHIDMASIAHAARMISACATSDGTVWTMGNGGSASTASHLAADLVNWASEGREPRIRSIALTDNVELITAIANDRGWSEVFSNQFLRHARSGDMLIAISVHGGAGEGGNGPWSQNIVRALVGAKERGFLTLGLSGCGGGRFLELCTHNIVVESDETPIVESLHLAICHLFCSLLRGER